ncbi:MAG: transferase [Magnetococcales bacterium]|nr:transferase [Magnetococcales bacterium]
MFLITTSMEETWRDDVPILFLGEWCRRFDRREKWQSLDAVVMPYHWDDREKLYDDYLYMDVLYEELLVELAEQLNMLNGVNHSVRYWRILVGPWLGYFVQIVFDRWTMLRHALRDYEIVGARVLLGAEERMIQNSMEEFQWCFCDDPWNEAICGRLLDWMGVPIERIAGRFDRDSFSHRNEHSIGFKPYLRKTIVRAANLLSGLICFKREYFFISSFLPVEQDLLLQWKLGQLPKRWRLEKVPRVSADHAARERRTIVPDNMHDFPSVVRAMIQRYIPTAYLEGYQSLMTVIRKLPWPCMPKVIFTSNSHASDDVFKAWAAGKVENGTPLVIGQHGGNYGMALWGFNEDHQIAISDQFLTWGWTESEQPKVFPVGNLKGFGRKIVSDKKGVALLVEMSMPRTSYHMYSVPVAHQWLDYFEDQCRFVQALPLVLQHQLLIRLFGTDFGWCQKQRWQERFSHLRLDDGVQPMVSLMKQSRLLISTYNATTYLESMSFNIPTIMFWNPQYWELRDSVQPFFDRLKSVGIFHDTPESAAKQMTEIWDDVDAWWQSELVQCVRREFCERYACIPERPLDVMEKLFREVASQKLSRNK